MGAKFLTIKKGSNKYVRKEGLNELCGPGSSQRHQYEFICT